MTPMGGETTSYEKPLFAERRGLPRFNSVADYKETLIDRLFPDGNQDRRFLTSFRRSIECPEKSPISGFSARSTVAPGRWADFRPGSLGLRQRPYGNFDPRDLGSKLAIAAEQYRRMLESEGTSEINAAIAKAAQVA
jgi:hypothetical protein